MIKTQVYGLEEVFDPSVAEESFKKILDRWQNVGDSQKKECLQRINILRDYFFNTLVDIKDEQDKEACFILMYILGRVRWILLQTRAGYTANTPHYDESVHYEAQLLATLIREMEERIPGNKVQFISHILLRSVEEPESEWDPESLEKSSLSGLYEKIHDLERQLTQKEQLLEKTEADWARVVRELKELMVARQTASSEGLPERYQDYDRLFAGLSAHHVAAQLERLREQNQVLEREALRWQEGQQLLLRELGETDASRIVERFRQLQDTITRLSLTTERPTTGGEPPARADSLDDLLLGIHDVLSGINA